MMRICTVFLFTFAAASVLAQESAPRMVAIPLTANDSHHRPTNVTLESLLITDQNTPVVGATLVRGADLPLQLGVLIDTSSSQRSADLNDILKAAEQFVNESLRGPEDRVFVLEFDAAPHATDWLKKEELRSSTLTVRLGGGTALYDALAVACNERMGQPDWQKPARRILVVISDGGDNMSHITRDDATLQALKAGAVIFGINTGPSETSQRGIKTMKARAEMTGGESFDSVGKHNAPKVFANIKETLEGMYYMRYMPPDASKSAAHEVEVKPVPKQKFKLSYARRYFWNQ